jgi:SAM-dependent methyltransferase
MPDTLNLGAGNVILPGAVNHDIRQHRPEIDVVHDLNVLPWPWEDESFDFISAQAVLEHLHITLVESMNECWRVLRPGGQIGLRIPWWNSDVSHRDPTHRWFFSLETLDIFDPTTEYGEQYRFYTDRKWRFIRRPAMSRYGTSIVAVMQVCK